MIPVSVVICTNSLKAVSGASATSSSPAGRSVARNRRLGFPVGPGKMPEPDACCRMGGYKGGRDFPDESASIGRFFF